MSEKIGHLHRVREIKKAETVAAHTDAPSMDRRAFLRGMLATVAVAATPTVLETTEAAAAPMERTSEIRERESRIESACANAKRALNSNEVRNALNGTGAWEDLFRVFDHEIDPRQLKGTQLDASAEQMRYCMQFAYLDNKQWLIPARAGKVNYANMSDRYFGNCVAFGNGQQVLVPQHIIDYANRRPMSTNPIDLRIVNLQKNQAVNPEYVIHDDTSLSNLDIHGASVIALGIDPKIVPTETGEDGLKQYPAPVAVRLSRAWIDKAFVKHGPEIRNRLARSFAILIPKGEAVGSGDAKPASGMSGSPVFVYRNSQKVFAGMIHSVLDVTVRGKRYDVAFFHGIEEVREQIASQIRVGSL